MTDPLSESNKRAGSAFDRLVGNLANAGVTAYVTHATGSPESGAAIGAMAAPLGEELSYALRKVASVKDRRSRALIESASIQSEIPVEELLQAIVTDPTRLELLDRAMTAARGSTSLLKVALLANILASGAVGSDDTVVDDQLMAIEALSQIDTPHLRMLVVLTERSPVWWDREDDRRRFVWTWPASRIIQKDPGLRVVFPAVAARLQSLGLTSFAKYGNEDLWTLTSFGTLCMGALLEANDPTFDGRGASSHGR